MVRGERSRHQHGRRALIGGAVLAALILLACSKDKPASGDNATNVPPGAVDTCSTPNEGCPCDEPEKVVECGRVKYQSGDNVTCEIGKRTCRAGRWGECVGEKYGVKGASVRVRSLKLLALADAGVDCAGVDFACDPFKCYQLADDTSGLTDAGPGMEVTEAGLTPSPSSDGGTTVHEGPYQGATNGVSACGATNVGVDGAGNGATCVPGGYDVCGQDYRCDVLTKRCIWNGGPGYFDSKLPAGTIDLTVGAPCGNNGSDPGTVPFCNRGNAPIPAGATIEFYQQASPTANAGCAAPTGTLLTTVTLANAMPPGQCVSTSVPNSAGSKAITGYLTSGATEASPYCQNNTAGWKTDGTPGCAACNSCTSLTTIKGKVYDPSGVNPAPTAATPADSVAARGANGTPLAGVSIFQPSGTLTALNDGLVCDTCASLSSPALYSALTDGKGEFTLAVTPGKNVPIVVQSGRWRRTVLVNADACVENDFEGSGKKGTFRLPRNTTDGYGGVANLPKMAITTGNQESLECLLTKIGVSDNQFGRYTSTATQRIQIFRDNGLDTSTSAPAATSLFSSTVLSKFNAVLSNCGGSNQDLHDSITNTHKSALTAYVNAGGRYFGNHYAAVNMINNPGGGVPGGADATWVTSPTTPGGNGVIRWTTVDNVIKTGNKAVIFQGQASPSGAAAAQAQLKTWMEAVGANGGYSNDFTSVGNPAPGALWAGNKATAWLGSNSALGNTCKASANTCQSNWDGSYYKTNNDRRLLSVSFRSGASGIETTCGAADGYGLVLFNQMHVAGDRTTDKTGTFPGTCKNNNLSPEEKALEYQIFQLTACNPGSIPPTPDPPDPPDPPGALTHYDATTYIRDYSATCPSGTRVSWSYFYWSAVIPTGDGGAGPNIEFRAATNDDASLLPATPEELKTVAIGTANATATNAVDMQAAPYNTTLAPVSVSSHLKIDPPTYSPKQLPMVSGDHLRVYMTFNPSADGTKAATLVDWKATYDCIDAE